MHKEEFQSSDQASHGNPARFTWRSRFLEARDQESLWFVSYVSKRKGRRQVRRGGESVIQKEKDDIRASFVSRRQHLKCPSGHKANSGFELNQEHVVGVNHQAESFPTEYFMILHLNLTPCQRKFNTLVICCNILKLQPHRCTNGLTGFRWCQKEAALCLMCVFQCKQHSVP